MAARIYTKTGDLGNTVLIGGTKVPKSHIRIESYGTVDELNSYIGLVADLIIHDKSAQMLREVQDRLFTIGSSLACDPDKEPLMKMPDLKESDVQLLESEIDRMTALLPEMRSFVLPGGHPTVSHIHVARCICRRAERICVHMQELEIFIDPLVIKYINRLSDYLFILSRFIAQELQVPEVAWKPRINQG